MSGHGGESDPLHIIEYAEENEIIGLLLFGFLTALIEVPIAAALGDGTPTFSKRSGGHGH